MRRRGIALLAVLVTLLAGLSPPAQARPVYPSKQEVERARQHAAALGAGVAARQAQVAQAAARVQAADLAVSTAAEDYDSAMIALADSRKAAAAAAVLAAQARQRVAGAQQQVGQLAAQTYRSGGTVASLDVLLSPGGPDDVLERASLMHVLGEQRQHTVQQLDSARVVANILGKQADQALALQAVATAKAAAARAAAEHQSSLAQAALAAQRAARNALLVEQAKAQKTTVALERARQLGLQRAAEARRRAAAAAAARREAARQAAAREAARREAIRQGRRPAATGSSSGWLGGFGGGGSASGSSASGRSAVAWAIRRVGLPYLWGGAGPASYDCSGLVMRAWQYAGVSLPHSSRAQYQQVEHVSYGQLRPGDLIFYATNPGNPGTIHHVAMYLGGGEMIEAPYTGANVRIVPMRRGYSMPYAGRP